MWSRGVLVCVFLNSALPVQIIDLIWCPVWAKPDNCSSVRRLSQQISQPRHKRQVGWRHGIFPQLGALDPLDFLVLARSDLAVPGPAHIKRHEKVERLVSVTGKIERRKARQAHLNAEFFLEFAMKRCFRRLVGFNLAARELPKAGKRFPFRAPGDEHAIIRVDEGDGCDQHDFRHGRRRIR